MEYRPDAHVKNHFNLCRLSFTGQLPPRNLCKGQHLDNGYTDGKIPIHLDAVIVSATRAGNNSPFTTSSIYKRGIEKKNLGQDIPYFWKGHLPLSPIPMRVQASVIQASAYVAPTLPASM